MKRIFEIALLVLFPFSIAVVSSCEDDITKPGDIVFPESGVSFKMHVLPLFNVTCARCHDGTREKPVSNLTYYQGVRYGPPPGMVDTAKPELSILIITIEAGHEFEPLPLNANHVKGIKQWVIEGALDN